MGAGGRGAHVHMRRAKSRPPMRPRRAFAYCAVAMALDAALSLGVELAARARESRESFAACSAGWFRCSFLDVLPLAAVRAAVLCLLAVLAFLVTRDWSRGVRAGLGLRPRAAEAGAPAREPLLNGNGHGGAECVPCGGEDGGEKEPEGPQPESDFQATQAKEVRFLTYKTVVSVLTFAVTVLSQIYVSIKVGVFKDQALFDTQITDHWYLRREVIPVALSLLVVVVNLEAMTFAQLVDSVWQPKMYTCESLHLHPLSYEPKHVAWSCKGCGKTLMQGFKVAFHCKKCDFNCCFSCYRKKMAQQRDARSPQATSKETDVTSWILFKLIMGLVATEIPLVTTALICVLGYTFVDNNLPDIQGRIFTDFYPPAAFDNFKHNLVRYVGFLLASRILNAVDTQSFQVVGLRLTCKLQKKLFGKILAQNTDFFDDSSVGDLTSRISREVPGMLQPCQRILPIVLSNLGTLTIGIFFCFKYSWKLSLCCFATIPPIIYITRAYAKWSSKLWLQQYIGWGAANHISTEAFSNIRTVHGFSTEAFEEKKFGMKLDQMLKYGILGAMGSAGSSFINGLLTMTTNMLVLGYGGYLVIQQLNGTKTGMDAGKLIAYNLYVNKMQSAFTSLQSQINALTQATGAAQRVMGLMQSLPDQEELAQLEAVDRGTVELRDVRFSYKARQDTEILKGLNLTVPGNSVCGIVGTSGAGKSTILSMLMQFYAPGSGEILVDGRPLSALDRRSVHQFMGVVTQDTQIFASSIEENIAYGVEGYVQEDLEYAAKMANAHDFISEFPEGYETMVGDRGVRLSGGQKQRIAIARLMMRRPKIVLLDEATSALDAESEAQVQEALDKMIAAGGRTVIIVAHRLSTVKNADKIAVMDQGVVAEEGTHAELLERDGIYAKLVSRQLESLSQVNSSASLAKEEGR